MSASTAPRATTVLTARAELRLAPATRLGRFELVGLIGRGGMGEVWLAEDTAAHGPSRRVALKVLGASTVASLESARRFEKERELLARVSHPGIVRSQEPLETDAARGLWFFPMELVLGKSLADLLAEHGRFPVLEAARVLAALAGALEATHASGIVHRDVKPSNVLLDRVGQVRLTDFGLARAVDDTRLTAPGSLLGTPAYMSPEQARGESCGPAADLYALGALGHELVAGAPPFAADNALALLRQHTDSPARALRELRPETPEALERTILRLLGKDPAARGDASALRGELEAIHAALAPEALAFANKVADSIDRTTRSLEALAPGEPVRSRAPAGLLGAGFVLGVAVALVGVGRLASPSPGTSPSLASPALSPGARALVTLRDGREFAGELSGLDALAIRLRGPDGVDRSFGAAEVAEIAYTGSASR